jgi:hypothetical protein
MQNFDTAHSSRRLASFPPFVVETRSTMGEKQLEKKSLAVHAITTMQVSYLLIGFPPRFTIGGLMTAALGIRVLLMKSL